LVTEERRNAEFTDFFNRMQLEDDDDARADPHLSNSESMYDMAEEMQAHPQPFHSGSSGAAQAIAPGHDTAPTIPGPAAPTIPSTIVAPTIPAALINSTIPAAVDRSLQAVAAPTKSKARPKPKPKNVPATKKVQNMLETPQVGVDGRAVVVDDFVVVDEVAAGGQPVGKATRSRKGKGRAVN
jgi:hypothetical protein